MRAALYDRTVVSCPARLCSDLAPPLTMSFEALFPETDALGTLADVLSWSKLTEQQWETLVASMGEPGLDEMVVIAAVPDEDWREALDKLACSAVARTRYNLAINGVRKGAGAALSDLGRRPETRPGAAAAVLDTSAVPNATATQASSMGDDGLQLRVNHYFDQGCKLLVRPAPDDVLKTMRDRWLTANSLEPSARVNLHGNQLSVLYRLAAAGHNLLAFDMGVWGPYSSRRERHMMVTVHQQNAAGQYVPMEIPGAQCLDDWLDGWAFATTGFVMGAVIERGVADAYRDHFKGMCENYPRAWWVACQAEWEFRFEFVPGELRRQRDFHAASPELSAFSPSMPFNSALLAGTKGLEAMQFWEDRLKEKARNWQDTAQAGRHPSWVHRQAALYSPTGHGGADARHWAGARQAPANVGNVQNPPGLGRRAAKRKAAEMKASESAGRRASRKPPSTEAWSSWANEKMADGRWKRLDDGTEICYAYSRNTDGCTTVCSANPKRGHACEWCRGQHRTINCPTHPNWTPPPQGQGGKGKGKGNRK